MEDSPGKAKIWPEFKGTVSQDFYQLFFTLNKPIWVCELNADVCILEYGYDYMEIFKLKFNCFTVPCD